MKYLNLGCGGHYHPDWINMDISPSNPDVINCDLSRGIPMDNDSVDVVYHSHVIEHFRKDDATRFMNECHRVLKPGGILRVATPDLEQICRTYLEKLASVRAGKSEDVHDYEWMLLEMYDQTVRERGGGGMLDYLRQNPIPNEAFIYGRIGEEGRNLVRQLREPSSGGGKSRLWPVNRRKIHKGVDRIADMVKTDVLAPLIFGREGVKALKIGRFRLGGEVHQWMYDQYSLSDLMGKAGFEGMMVQSASSSLIPQWTVYHLDTLPDGTVYKPDSMYMEAIKPERR